MKSEITKKTDTNVSLKITADEATLKPILMQTYERLRASVKAQGFRPGKAPDHIVERELGTNAVQHEVLEAAITQAYAKAITEHTLAVLAPPDVSVTKFVPYSELEYTAVVDVMPKITLADYKKFKIKRPEVKIEAKEVDQTIEDLRKRLATRNLVDRAAKIGDEVTIDFSGTKDGKAVEGAEGKNHDLELGSKSFIPGFEELLVGTKKGDHKTFDINFPNAYHQADLAGQKVTFAVTVHSVREVNLPEVNAEFVANVSPFKTLAELRADIELRIKAEKAEQVEREYEDKVLVQLVEKSQLSLPQRLVDQQLSRMQEEFSQRLASSGLDTEKYLGLVNKSLEQLNQEMRPQAEKRVALGLILNEVAKSEDITVTSAEIEAEVKHLRETYKDPSMQAELADPSILEDVHNHLVASRTIAKIIGYIKA